MFFITGSASAQAILGGKRYMPGITGQPMRAVGLAGAVDAISMGTTGLYYNPAGILMSSQYAINAGYAFSGGAKAHTARVSVVDSKTNPMIAGGIGYSLTYCYENPNQTITHSFKGAIAGKFGNKKYQGSVGIIFDYQHQNFGPYSNMTGKDKQTGKEYLGADNGLTFTAGAQMTISGVFHSAVVVRNLRKLGKSTPRRMEIGTGVTYKFVNIDTDIIFDFDSKSSTTTSFAFSSEFVTHGFSIRTGFNMDRVIGAKMIGAGLGYASKWVGFDVGYNHDLSNLKHWFIGLDIAVYLHK